MVRDSRLVEKVGREEGSGREARGKEPVQVNGDGLTREASTQSNWMLTNLCIKVGGLALLAHSRFD